MLRAPLIGSLVRGAQVHGVGDIDPLALKETAVVDSVGGLFDSDPLIGSAFVDAASTGFTIQTSTANLLVEDTADHVIDATEARNVTFTVSGLNPGAIGRVSFTDSDHDQVQVNIDSNGTYSADISTLMGGTITSALLAIDLLTGTSFAASGNPVLLEKSVTNAALAVNSTADHVINATESTAVTFTVSGLTPGETGVVTFTDASSHHIVVGVHGNGSYSANLSPLMEGSITSSLSAIDRGGQQRNRYRKCGDARHRQRIETKPLCRCYESRSCHLHCCRS